MADSSSNGILRFPAGFLWGVSTSSYQNEGGNLNCQWARWEAQGRIRSGDCCGLACDWWHNADPDLDLARDLGLNALRLSVEWSRIEPGRGDFDSAAIKRYREILTGLQQRQLRPFVCLHHFTNPLWFEEQGGFASPDSVAAFEKFARRTVEALGDLCQDWLTFNEPNVYAILGYQVGEWPPGKAGDFANACRVIANLARAHAAAYDAIHQLQPSARVGWTQNYLAFQPADPDSVLDRSLARWQGFFYNDPFIDLVEKGQTSFPVGIITGDVPEARGKLDFAGVNVYGRVRVEFNPTTPSTLFGRVIFPPDAIQGDSDLGFPFPEIYPQAIALAVQRVSSLGKPIYVLENGVPDRADRLRPWLIVNAAREVHDLIRSGHDIRGYFHWTLTDNFEWNHGWALRFGLVELDPQTQKRTVRNSGRIFSAIVRGNAVSHEMLEEFGRTPERECQPK
ncbi:MAG TPA: family 1 glycosylhydrolase [Terriglobales bacterium]|nr:family 1 glycosylhydrolase [Terriglobales bacterium]